MDWSPWRDFQSQRNGNQTPAQYGQDAFAKPARVQTMLVADIESTTFAEPQAWTSNRREDIRKVSVHNITSLSAEELVEYVKGTTLLTPCWRSWMPVA